jgi:hypothetical protein
MFQKWPKIPRIENEKFHVTEKIDGTNSCIVIQKFDNLDIVALNPIEYFEVDFVTCVGVWAQSRTRLITPDDDNFGFAKWVEKNAEQLIEDLGVGYHYGEWWGQGINRGYGLDHKRFSLFNPTKHSSICHNIPEILTTDIMPNDFNLKDMLREHGSYVVPGYMRPEGVIIYAEAAKSYWKVILDK